ncbi:MAG TPA: helix-turn-helix domain-containing protein [Anaerolineaceae bacterium]|nr:helix-turn-helix domain-containing protein [Anaerolineaceae bacterium]HPN51018.1 helix-turn-helix domain-containing protein [Anaerolineaceae bacterium]
MNLAKQQILEAAARLFEKQGYHATGLNEIIRESGAPKGSLYYYFPEGKEQIGAETALWSAGQMAGRIRTGLAQSDDPAEAVRLLGLGTAEAIENAKFSAGGPLMMLAAESAVSSERLNAACREAYGLMQAAFSEKFSGNEPLARFVLAVLEGAILLSRVNHSADAVRQAAQYLETCVKLEMNKEK